MAEAMHEEQEEGNLETQEGIELTQANKMLVEASELVGVG